MNATPSAKPTRQLRLPMRYGMRSILVLTLLAAIVCAEFGRRLRRAQRQLPAVSFVTAVGGTVGYDFQELTRDPRNPARWVIRGQSPYPQWLVRRLGIDFFHNVREVHVEATRRLPGEVSEALWESIGQLRDVEVLDTGFVTRPGSIRALVRHRRLKSLALRCSEVADDDFSALSSLGNLQEVILNDTPVTDAAIRHIGECRGLGRLELHFAKITDACMDSVAGLAKLEQLRLSATAIGDKGVERLRGHPALTELDLHFTPLTDAALESIASIPDLTVLDLGLTKITDAGVSHLAGHPRLRELNLGGTSASGIGLDRMPALEDLCLGGMRGNNDLSWVAGCRRLRRLSLPTFDIGEDGFDLARWPPELSELCLEHTQISDATLLKLAAVPGMRLIRYPWPQPDLLAPPQFLKSTTSCILQPTHPSAERLGKERYRR